jgi:hypothetical protein
LYLAVAAEQHTEIIKPCDHALKFDAVDQEDRERRLGLADGVEKRVLKVLFFFHFISSFLVFERLCARSPYIWSR